MSYTLLFLISYVSKVVQHKNEEGRSAVILDISLQDWTAEDTSYNILILIVLHFKSYFKNRWQPSLHAKYSCEYMDPNPGYTNPAAWNALSLEPPYAADTVWGWEGGICYLFAF